MGKILKTTYVTRDDQLLQLKAGPISILTGANLRSSTETSSQKPKAERSQQKAKKPFRVADLDDEEFKQLYDALM